MTAERAHQEHINKKLLARLAKAIELLVDPGRVHARRVRSQVGLVLVKADRRRGRNAEARH